MPGGGQQPDGAEYACAQAWTALSAAHALVTDHLTAALNQACGLSIHEFEVLLRVAHVADGGLRLVALSKMVCLTQPSLSRTVARLERQGWLVRQARQATAVVCWSASPARAGKRRPAAWPRTPGRSAACCSTA